MSRERYSLRAVAPDAYAAMVALDRNVHDAPLPRPLLELVKMRASQLNGCIGAYRHTEFAGYAGHSGRDIRPLGHQGWGPDRSI
jgi:alkylhydroperoxidase family enzyme